MADNSATLYVIGIGGTGSKCLESIAQLASVGLFTDNPIKLIFVDADETNGNLIRARDSLKTYREIHTLLKSEQSSTDWLTTEIPAYSPEIWSPFGRTKTNKTLSSVFGYTNLAQNEPELKNLFDVLFTEAEREASLDVGFRGRPAIGSAIISRLDFKNLNEEPWATFIGNVKTDTGGGKKPHILLCGSIFGGTGASGLPTLAKLLHKKLEAENIREQVRLASLFILPYFQFQPTGGEAKNEVYASADQFLLNTEAALRYYQDQNQHFDGIYLLGNQNRSRYKFSIGKDTQRNEPHFIELYAGLIARHFLLSPPPIDKKVVLLSRQETDKIKWSDLPEWMEIQGNIINGVRFAYIWLANILPELTLAREMGIKRIRKGAPWIEEFYRPENSAIDILFTKKGEDLPKFSDQNQQDAIISITEWCEDYLRWIIDIHNCDADEVNLFRIEALKNFDGAIGGEQLRYLVINDTRDAGKLQRDEIMLIKQKLHPNVLEFDSVKTGTIGLAKALYLLSQKQWYGEN
jgi:hypothetical protein